MCNLFGAQLFMHQEHIACNQTLSCGMGLTCETSVERPSSATKRLRFASTYSRKGAKFGVERVNGGQNICNKDASVGNGKNFEKQAQSSKG